jgi:hypothetical protein
MPDVGNFLKEWWNENAYTDPRMNPFSPEFAPMEGAKAQVLERGTPAIEKAPNRRSGATPHRRRLVGANMGVNAAAGEIANIGVSMLDKATKPYQDQLAGHLNTQLKKVGHFIDDNIHRDKWAGPIVQRPGQSMGIMSSTFDPSAPVMDKLIAQEMEARIKEKGLPS